MTRSRLLNMFLKYKTETNRKTTKLKGTFAKSFSKPLKNHSSTLSIRKKIKIPTTGQFGKPPCLTLHKR